MSDETPQASNFELMDSPKALEAVQRAEIDVQIATAKRYPRILSQVKQRMLNFATLDVETATSCFYALPRGGKTIQGPSVRLAEIAASCFGNLRAATRVISVVSNGENPHVVVQSVCHDLEGNISVSMEKRRRITGKKLWANGKPAGNKPPDEDDINLAANACSAIAFRDAVFKVVPMALVKPVFEQAKKVAIGDAKTLADRRAKAIDLFAKMGVNKEKVLMRLDKKSVEEVGLEDLEILIGLHNAIREDDMSIDDAFPPPPLVGKAETDDKAEADAGLAPKRADKAAGEALAALQGQGATITQAEPKSQPAGQPSANQAALADLVTQAGYTLGHLLRWGTETGNVPDFFLDSEGIKVPITSFDELPDDICKRMLRAKTGLLRSLEQVKKQEAK